MSKEFICIVCPRGCHLQIDDQMRVSGNKCPKGEAYAKKEVTNPCRLLTSTVKIDSTIIARLPVRSSDELPKNKIQEIVNLLNDIIVMPPIKKGDIVIKNVLGTQINIVATRSISK